MSALQNNPPRPKRLPTKKAARVAKRGGSAISGTSSAPRPTRVKSVRGGSR